MTASKPASLTEYTEKLDDLKRRFAKAGGTDDDFAQLDEAVQAIAKHAATEAIEQEIVKLKRPPMSDTGQLTPQSIAEAQVASEIGVHGRVSVQSGIWGPISVSKYAVNNPHASGVALDRQFKHFGEMLQSAYIADKYGRLDARLKALGETSGEGGGFLVPEEFRAQLMMLVLEDAIMRPRATIIPMTRLEMRIPAVHDTTHASTVFGGVQFYWTGEAATVTSTDPRFKQLLLVAKKLMGDTAVANELVEDSPFALEALLTQMFGQAMTFFEDKAFINGTGAGEPLGILNSPALVSVAKETGQAANTIVVENIDKMYARMMGRSKSRGIWLANHDTYPQLAALKRDVGTGGSAVMQTNMAVSPFNTINGRPVIFTELCQTLGTLGDIYFIDPSYYLIGDRQELSVSASAHVLFRNDQTVYKVIERLDGRPWLDSALTPAYGSNTLSPFVALATRA